MIHVSLFGHEGGRYYFGYDEPGSSGGEYLDFPAPHYKRMFVRVPRALGPRDFYTPDRHRLQLNLLCHLPFTFKGRMYTFRHVKPNQEESHGK